MQAQIIKHINQEVVQCLTCKQIVTIVPIQYGTDPKGFIAQCPVCGKLAANK